MTSFVLFLCRRVQPLLGKARVRRCVEMQTVIDTAFYIDSGLLSGLEAMSELRELLDELYGRLD